MTLFRSLMILGVALGSSTTSLGGNGFHQLDAWQLEDALETAQKELSDDHEDVEHLWLAARVQNARGHHLEAMSILQSLNDIPEAYRNIIDGPAYYADDSYVLESEHFRVRFRDKDEIVAYYAQEVLEKTYTRIGAVLQFYPAEGDEKIAVEIYPDARGLARATGLTVRQIETSGTIAVCKYHRLMIISPLATANGYGWADTLAHEFIHLVISKKSRNNVPIWLHEGIAKYYESSWRGEPGLALAPSSEKLLKEAVDNGGLITFDQMHPSMAKLPSQESAALAFAEVFTMIEFLNKRFGPQRIPKLLDDLAKTASLETSLRSIFGAKLATLEKNWRTYLKSRTFKTNTPSILKRVALVPDGQRPQEDRPIEEINEPEIQKFARLGELLETRGHTLAAKKEYQRAWEKSGSFYATLNYRYARLLLKEEAFPAAQRVLDQSLRRHPEDSDCRLLAGRLSLKQKMYDDAAEHYRFVLHQNPFNPEVHQALAAVALAQDDREAIERGQHFYNLASRPRPQREDRLPSNAIGTTGVHLLSSNWGKVEVVGVGTFQTPRMFVPLSPGVYQIQAAARPQTVQRITVEPETLQWVEIDAR